MDGQSMTPERPYPMKRDIFSGLVMNIIYPDMEDARAVIPAILSGPLRTEIVSIQAVIPTTLFRAS